LKILTRSNHLLLQRLILLCVLLIPLLNSCRSAKDISANSHILTSNTASSFLTAYNNKSFQYNTLSANIQFNIVVSSGKELNSRGLLKILKDDRIQISIRPFLGIEAIRAELTPDSIKIMNRLNRWYLVESFDHIKGETAIDFNFYNLQDLTTNRLFLPGEINLADEQFHIFSWEQTNTGYLMRTSERTGLQYTFTADSNEKLISTEIKDDTTNYLLDCNYNNFLPVGHQIFPMNLHINLHSDERTQHSLSLIFSRMEVDQPLSMNFDIPANYRQVSLAQIIHSIEQL